VRSTKPAAKVVTHGAAEHTRREAPKVSEAGEVGPNLTRRGGFSGTYPQTLAMHSFEGLAERPFFD
jgi:hypothetical protein